MSEKAKSELKIGDTISGPGNTLKDETGQPLRVTGILHALTPGDQRGDIQVLIQKLTEVPSLADRQHIPHRVQENFGKWYLVSLEYGDAVNFQKLSDLFE